MKSLLFLLLLLFLTASCSKQDSSSTSIASSSTSPSITSSGVAKAPEPVQLNIPRKRTMEAWQAIQKADGEAQDSLSSTPDFQKSTTIQPYFQALNRTATAYSQIDLTDVDPLLANHIAEGINAYVSYAAALKSYYLDLSKLAEDLNQNVEVARRLGKSVGSSSGADIAEILARLASDEDVKKKMTSIVDKHSTNILEAKAKFEAVGKADQVVAKQLTEKFGTPFLDAF
jgi:hypothetical protein